MAIGSPSCHKVALRYQPALNFVSVGGFVSAEMCTKWAPGGRKTLDFVSFFAFPGNFFLFLSFFSLYVYIRLRKFPYASNQSGWHADCPVFLSTVHDSQDTHYEHDASNN